MKITKRDIKFFFLGMLTLLVIEAVYDWKNTVDSFKRGYHAGTR